MWELIIIVFLLIGGVGTAWALSPFVEINNLEQEVLDAINDLVIEVNTVKIALATETTRIDNLMSLELRTVVRTVSDEAINEIITLSCNSNEVMLHGGWDVSNPFLKVVTGYYPIDASTIGLHVRAGAESGTSYTITLSGMCMQLP